MGNLSFLPPQSRPSHTLPTTSSEGRFRSTHVTTLAEMPFAGLWRAVQRVCGTWVRGAPAPCAGLTMAPLEGALRWSPMSGPTSSERYRQLAENCRKRASEVTSSNDKEEWLRLAEDWLRLAHDVEWRQKL
jgi:hypothetical protein